MSRKCSKPPFSSCHSMAAIVGSSSRFVFLGHLCPMSMIVQVVRYFTLPSGTRQWFDSFYFQHFLFTINCDRERQFSCFLFICLMVSASEIYSSVQKRRRRQFPQDWQKKIPNKDRASRQCLQSELQQTSPVWQSQRSESESRKVKVKVGDKKLFLLVMKFKNIVTMC